MSVSNVSDRDSGGSRVASRSSSTSSYIERTFSEDLCKSCIEDYVDSAFSAGFVPSIDDDEYFEYEYPRKSFQCIRKLDLSRSSLLNDPFFKYPYIEDPGLNDALWKPEPTPVYDKFGWQKYLDLCEKYNVMPIFRFYKSLSKEEVNLQYYGISTNCLRPIMETITTNKKIKIINLENNILDTIAISYISNMLVTNEVVETLILRRCNVGKAGAEVLYDGFQHSKSLKVLDISCNDIGDEGIVFFEPEDNKSNSRLKNLNFSKNNLGLNSIESISCILETSVAIEEIDLSWNSFNVENRQALRELCSSFGYNSLKTLKLTWNNLCGRLFCIQLQRFLADPTCSLTHLDLSHNKFHGDDIPLLVRALVRNFSLLEFKIGSNPLTPNDVGVLLTVFELPRKGPELQLETLDMDRILVSKLLKETITDLKTKGVNIIHGGYIFRNENVEPEYKKICVERIEYLLTKKPKKKSKKAPLSRDFGEWLYLLEEDVMIRDDFEKAVKISKMKLDADLITLLMKQFSTKAKKVDLQAMRSYYTSLYPWKLEKYLYLINRKYLQECYACADKEIAEIEAKRVPVKTKSKRKKRKTKK